ncbi:MAG: Signal peptidase IB [Candidatus Anoxychlamydiales bacterium]|nr:Signal peptidase IB [Candidatus Anoxychlamydiales bacterium]
MLKSKTYSLYRCKKVLRHIYPRYKRKRKHLSDIQKKRFENILTSLQTSINKKNKKAADRAAKNLENLAIQYLKKSALEQVFDIFIALVFAIVVAIAVRQMWFELMTIPTGSMRPTLKEKDILLVSKTDFGINVPLQTKHLYFDPDLLKRGSIVIFSSKNLDIADQNMLYFYIFPGKKQIVKRLIGKPGDILYFYGGRIYGIDKHGNEIKELNSSEYFKNIEHIPFIRFDGKVLTPQNFSKEIYSPVVFYQMNEPLAMLNINPMGQIESELLTEHASVFTKDSSIKNYYDIWGFKNFAMSRILTKEEVEKYSNDSLEDVEEAQLYLELTHHPSLKNSKIIRDEYGRLRPALNYSTSIIPLFEDSLKKIFDSMYTARFCVKNGAIYRYGSKFKKDITIAKLEDVTNGCYEIQNGKAYFVNFLGMTKKLKNDHLFNQFSIERTKTFYNLGIEFANIFKPHKKNQLLVPSRYGYFRNNDFYLMGHVIFKQDDPTLVSFLQREYKKQQSMTNQYKAFEDLGPPFDTYDGKFDKNIIRKFGIKIPEKMYLVLGDNHAMSADSRDFGFVPEDNLKGGVNFIFWPPSSRWGEAFQPPFEKITFPKLIIWSSAFVIVVVSTIIIRRRTKKPLKF